MSRLFFYLKKLKKEEEINKAILKKEKSRKSFSIALLSFMFILFVSSILAGFYLIKLLQNQKKEKPISQILTSKEINSYVETERFNTKENPISDNSSIKFSDNQSSGTFGSLSNSSQINKKVSKLKKVDKKLNSEIKTKKDSNSSLKTSKILQSSPRDKAISTVSPPDWTPLKTKELYYNLLLTAEIEREKGNYEEAIRLYKKYLKYKEDPDVLNNLASVYLLKGENSKAQFYLERALKLKNDPIYEINYFISLVKQGRVREVCEKIKTKEYPSYLSEMLESLRKKCN